MARITPQHGSAIPSAKHEQSEVRASSNALPRDGRGSDYCSPSEAECRRTQSRRRAEPVRVELRRENERLRAITIF